MARRYLGDHRHPLRRAGPHLPHHENEIAQSECCNGVPLSPGIGCTTVYQRGQQEDVQVSGQLLHRAGRGGTVRLRAHPVFPHLLLLPQPHQLQPRRWWEQGITPWTGCTTAGIPCVSPCPTPAKRNRRGCAGDRASCSRRGRSGFIAAMEDDLNTADAIAALFELVRDINSRLTSSGGTSKSTAPCRRLCEEASAPVR